MSATSSKTVSRFSGVLVTLIVGILLVFFIASSGIVGFDGYLYGPTPGGGRTVEPTFYESRIVSPDESVFTPTIQSDIVTEPYARLFVPQRPNRDIERLQEICPEIEPHRSEGFYIIRMLQRAERKLEELAPNARACFARAFQVSLNGVLQTVEPEFSIHPQTKVRGLLYFIPLTELASGRHELRIERVVPESWEDDDNSQYQYPPWRYTIPFWR